MQKPHENRPVTYRACPLCGGPRRYVHPVDRTPEDEMRIQRNIKVMIIRAKRSEDLFNPEP